MGALGNLIPLVILAIVVGGFAYVGYQMYIFANDLTDRGVRKLEKKNIAFTKDGVKVHVKELGAEEYESRTQNVLVNTWNNASFPAYKSRLWNTMATPAGGAPAKEGVKPRTPSTPH
ncbi:hypothetical protein EJ06DRAFT_348001 [Trichodelitschia bisporula]|uniref:Uncharacterized protein n=1 Tax=Trichodelitschia bisporula TaxID=703511 RepID=A0A6G1I3G3_9PEZI|nr:hypothetical protein EJ06DRAFT_348001 [Trichodelitschia bisporula]